MGRVGQEEIYLDPQVLEFHVAVDLLQKKNLVRHWLASPTRGVYISKVCIAG